MNAKDFQELITQRGIELYRSMPWREDTRPYYILVSELMLQQTQVDRVIPKFQSFISRFPNEQVLGEAPLSDVLTLWSGLGYNRRAKYLHDTAKMITYDLEGEFPSDHESLLRLSGVGPNTAGAILAYAFNKPAVFIETNVRTVYFYHFFEDGEKVPDQKLKDLVNKTIDTEHPREFYWALMDYGTYLKKQGAGSIRQSAHYKKQTALKGSIREVRGLIIKHLTQKDLPVEELGHMVVQDQRFVPALEGLLRDGLVAESHGQLHLTK